MKNDILEQETHRVFCWIRQVSGDMPKEASLLGFSFFDYKNHYAEIREKMQIIFFLSDLAHNWPALMNGKDFTNLKYCADQCRQLAKKEFKSHLWRMTIQPGLLSIAEEFEKQEAA